MCGWHGSLRVGASPGPRAPSCCSVDARCLRQTPCDVRQDGCIVGQVAREAPQRSADQQGQTTIGNASLSSPDRSASLFCRSSMKRDDRGQTILDPGEPFFMNIVWGCRKTCRPWCRPKQTISRPKSSQIARQPHRRFATHDWVVRYRKAEPGGRSNSLVLRGTPLP